MKGLYHSTEQLGLFLPEALPEAPERASRPPVRALQPPLAAHHKSAQFLTALKPVYAGRTMPTHRLYSTGWHNPFREKDFGAELALQKFEEYLLNNQQLLDRLPTLTGATLGCWCWDLARCHTSLIIRAYLRFVKTT